MGLLPWRELEDPFVMVLSNHAVHLEAPLRGLKARQKPSIGVDERLQGGLVICVIYPGPDIHNI